MIASTEILIGNAPQPVQPYLARLNIQPAEIEFAAEADLNLDGATCSSFLIGTADRLFAITPSAATDEQVIGPIYVKSAERFRTFSAVGSAFFQVKVQGLFLDLVRFSNARREQFDRIATQLENRRKERPFVRGALTEPDSRLCPVCSLPLPGRRAACPRCAQEGGLLARAYGLLKRYRGRLVVLMVMMLTVVGLEFVPPILLGKVLVNQVLVPMQHGGWLIWLVAAIALAQFSGAFLNVLIGRTSTAIGTRVTFDLRRQLQEKLMDISVDFYDRTSVGSLMSRVLWDVEYFHGAVNQIAQGFLVNLLKIIGIGAVLFYLNWRLALLVMIPIPLVVVGTMFFWSYVYPRYFRVWDGQSKLAALLNGLLSGIRLVKAFAQEERERDRFSTMASDLRDSRRGLDMSMATFNPIMGYVFGLGGLIVWYAGGRQVLGETMKLGDLITFLSLIGMFYGPIQQLTMFSNWVTGFLSSCQRVFEILDVEPGIGDAAKPVPLPRMAGGVEFRNVTFGYDPYDPVIKDISFKIEPGQMIGIVGKSGSGKTTLMNLLCRFYDVQQGEIMIDGVDVRKLRRADIRRGVGLVLQEPFLFRSSIAANIAYGRPGAPPTAIMDAAKAAYAHEFIVRLPAAYDTRLGERGAGISGGERQRVSIARALLCDPTILILDEATSSVDTEAEQQIQQALGQLCKGRTTIAIAHRLSTLRGADKILVLDNGAIVEQGSHDELMKIDGGVYAKLVRIQTELTRIEQ
ncbi:MAG: ABC transporter ATP-binding protein [Phycisphaerae bacterium]|nr:ABC transporter ATP-binding protein [Phycisphaerae bacterium]